MASTADDEVSLQSIGSPPLQRGYPTLSAYMSKSPSSTILSRFSALNAQNLLYYQAELILLEKQLRQQEFVAGQTPSCDPRSRFARDWEWINITETDTGFEQTQITLIMRLRTVLREYSMCYLVVSYELRGKGLQIEVIQTSSCCNKRG